MPRQGILQDYDSWANKESSAKKNTCFICGANPMSYQWADYSGEAMCTRCRTPYQLKWGTNKEKKENKYPYLNLKREYVPLVKKYWKKFKQFTCFGQMLGYSEEMAKTLNKFEAWKEQEQKL